MTLDPGQDGDVTAISIKDTYSRETPLFEPSQVINWDGSNPIFVFGRITYQDTAGQKYCTPFLMHYLPGNWAYTLKLHDLSVGDLCPNSH